ncbi:class I SAM-dependent methyltransferase [Yinghuangia soli]|uniref:Class I SAM-dependent methyltransferase n=1 Tax=Yinghuangia soli TaxID=2908204 RepID=A0AA41U6R3_9ACTN|nr:class I SAM-dependent methyltransferase [Yinghuangia soli]MCF2533282.1 class I SAM-dependent methyltransferase [Yinghuangia soli]
MGDTPGFDPDLYQGTADYYDRFRLPYPDAMIDDLAHRTAPADPGPARLIDLACGTGQLAFPLHRHFADVLAVDAEPDMTAAVRAKAAALKADGITAVTSGAEALDVDPGSVDLVVIGNAFHRLDRALVAARIHSWLRPGGYLALCWSTSPWAGDAAWQRDLDALIGTWKDTLGATSRVPAGWHDTRETDPDHALLARAGFQPAGRHDFPTEHQWTVAELAGHIRSTSFLPPAVLADRSPDFDAALAAALERHTTDGRLAETVGFTYELVSRPA